MPDFTPGHLERLPIEIRDIMNLPCYQALSEKRRSIMSKGFQAYRDLPDAEKISKAEVVETKRAILEHMIRVGVLEVIYQQVTVDMVASWLKNNKPVFLMTGRQLNLEKSALHHLIGNPRFLKEFLLDSEDTEKFIKAVSDLQRAHAASGFPSSTLPRVGIVGGGAIARSCELDLNKKLQPNLEIVSIAPEVRLRSPNSLLPAQRSMAHQFVPGYCSEVVLCKDKNAIESVGILKYPGREMQYIRTSLFIHVYNDQPPAGKWKSRFCKAMDSITKFLDEKAPDNGLIRDYAIGPKSYEHEIVFRINEPWHTSLWDDKVLIEKLKFLIQQDPDQAAIVASGASPMVNRLIWLAASLDYRGQFYQVVLPTLHQDERAVVLSEELESKGKFVRRPIQGRLQKVMINGAQLDLEVHDSDGKSVSDVPRVDFLVNGIGKTKMIPLIKALIEEGYIQEDDAAQGNNGLHSCHPMLSGHYTIFQSDWAEDDITSPGLWWPPLTTTPRTQPFGWEEAFNLACKMLQECA